MISVMDMTTGLFDSDSTAPVARCASGESTPLVDKHQENLALQAGLREYVTARSLCFGMPVGMATLNLDDFIARMSDFTR